MVLSDFVASHLGQCTTDGDPYGCQCVALIYAYCDALGVQRLTGNAIDMAAQPNPGFAWIPMGSGPLGAGDVVVWGQTPTLGIGTLGHVDIAVDSITTSSYRGLDQNWYASDLNNGSPAAYVTHGYVGVLGWHHFQGADMNLSLKEAIVRLAYLAALGREPESQAALDGWANQIADDGSNADQIIATIADSPEGQGRLQNVAKAATAAAAGVSAAFPAHTHPLSGTTGSN